MFNSRKRVAVVSGLIFLCGAGMALGFYAAVSFLNPLSPSTLQTCFSRGYYNQITPNQKCITTTVDALLDRFSTTELMRYIVSSSSPEIIYGNCHVIAHTIGKESYIKIGSIEETLSKCTDSCLSGCVHGAIGAAVSKELGEAYDVDDIAHVTGAQIETVGKKYCTIHGLCHAIGHLLYMSYGDFSKSLHGCAKLAVGINREACYEGIFMESSDANESFSVLLKGSASSTSNKPNTYAYPCDSVPMYAQQACFIYLPVFQQTQFNREGISPVEARRISENTCKQFSPSARAYCIQGLAYQKALSGAWAMHSVTEACADYVSSLDYAACVTGNLLEYMNQKQYSTGAHYCGTLNSFGATPCFNMLFQLLKYKESAPSVQDLCTSVDSDQCLARYATYEHSQSRLPDSYFDLYNFLRSPINQSN